LQKKDKIIISFYIFLAITIVASLSYIDTMFDCEDFYPLKVCEDPEHDPEERPFIEFAGVKLNEIKTESTFNIEKEIIFNVMANVGNYHKILPKNIISVEIIEEEDNVIIAKEVLMERGVKITTLVKHTLTPYNEHTIEIMDGDAKGTTIKQTFIEDEGSTKISTEVELKLKGIVKSLVYIPKSNFEHAIDTVNTSFVEYAEMFKSPNVKIIDDTYRDLLFRPVDHESLEYWLPQLESGLITPDNIKNELLNSEEKKMVDWNSLSHDEKLMQLSDNTKTVIDTLYLDLLDRQVDEHGLAYWGSLLENEIITEEELEAQLYNSKEATTIRELENPDLERLGYERMITTVFFEALERNPTGKELEHYIEIFSKIPASRGLSTEEGIEKERIISEVHAEIAKLDELEAKGTPLIDLIPEFPPVP